MALTVTILSALAGVLLVSWKRAWLAVLLVLWFVRPVGDMGIGHYSAAIFFAAASLPFMMNSARPWMREKFVRFFAMVAAVEAVSALWADVPQSAVHEAIRVCVVGGAVVSVLVVVDARESALRSALAWAAPFVVLQCATVIYLNHHVSAKREYYGSRPAHFLLGDVAREAARGDATINAMGAAKTAGALFTNGNRASMVMGVCALVYLAFALYAKKRWPVLVAVICVIGVVETQSKSGIGLLIVSFGFALVVAGLANRMAGMGRLWGLFVAPFVALVAFATFPLWGAGISERVEVALEPRMALWSTAWQSVMDHPLTGWGWGGWWHHWPAVAAAVGSRPSYPPHNSLLYAGTKAGLPLILVQFAVAASLFFFALRHISRMSERRDRWVLALSGGAALWSFAHGMGDNTLFFGTMNSVLFVAIGMAMCHRVRSSGDRADPPKRPSLRPSVRRYEAVHRELVAHAARKDGVGADTT